MALGYRAIYAEKKSTIRPILEQMVRAFCIVLTHIHAMKYDNYEFVS